MVSNKSLFAKKVVMISSLIAMLISMRLPFAAIAKYDISFSTYDLMRKASVELHVKAILDVTTPVLSVNTIPYLAALISIVILLVLTIFPTKINRLNKIIYGVFSVSTIMSLVSGFGLLRLNTDALEKTMGIGAYLSLLLVIVYMLYACIPGKTPIIEVNIHIILLFTALLLVYPYINTLALALDQSGERINIWPRQFTFNNFAFVLFNPKFLNGAYITLIRTLLGTICSLVFTTVFSYAMSKPKLVGRKIYLKLCIITMYFSGGLIPTFILFNQLNLVNNFMVYIIPNLLNAFNMILMVNYFKGLPDELEESAKIDGAGDFRILFQIIWPVSMPVIAIIGLYNAVFQWNSWYDGYIFMIGRTDLKPLQNVLIDIINESQIANFLINLPIPIKDLMTTAPIGKSIVAAAIILTIGPIILFYPFLQKYFVKGMLIGSVKQ